VLDTVLAKFGTSEAAVRKWLGLVNKDLDDQAIELTDMASVENGEPPVEVSPVRAEERKPVEVSPVRVEESKPPRQEVPTQPEKSSPPTQDQPATEDPHEAAVSAAGRVRSGFGEDNLDRDDENLLENLARYEQNPKQTMAQNRIKAACTAWLDDKKKATDSRRPLVQELASRLEALPKPAARTATTTAARPKAAVGLDHRRKQEMENTIKGANEYIDAPLPSGGWGTMKVPFQGATERTAEVSATQETVRIPVDKKTALLLSEEKTRVVNEQLEKSGCRLRLEPQKDPPTHAFDGLPGKKYCAVQPVLQLDETGPDGALARRRKLGEPVTYADCHRNAVVSAGFPYDPKKDAKDCERVVIPGGPPKKAAPKIEKDLRDLFERDDLVVAGKELRTDKRLKTVLGNLARYTSHVGERNARAVLGQALETMESSGGEIKAAFDLIRKATAAKVDADCGPVLKENYKAPEDKKTEQLTLIKDVKETWNLYAVLAMCAEPVSGSPEEATAARQSRLVSALGMSKEEAAAVLKAIPATALGELATSMKVNQHCDPKPGQVMAMVPAGASDLWEPVDNEHTRAELQKRQVRFAADMERHDRQAARAARANKVEKSAVTAEMGEKYFKDLKQSVADAGLGDVEEITEEVMEMYYDQQVEALASATNVSAKDIRAYFEGQSATEASEKPPTAMTAELFEKHKGTVNAAFLESYVPAPTVTPEILARNMTKDGRPDALEMWNMHWAGVAMRDGDEVVTFENFSVENQDAMNDKWMFGTYGKKSFYDESMDSGFFGPAGVAMCFEQNPDY
jgi:hypothetical protein